MSGYGAEGASAEASPVYVNRVTNHIVGRYTFVFVFWMRQTSIWQVETCIQFLCGHGREWWVYHSKLSVHLLQQSCSVHSV